jgi:hypothetical protein
MMFSRKQRYAVGLMAVLVLSGVGAATASAEGPHWLVNGVELKEKESVKAVGKGNLSFLVEGLGLRIQCKSLAEKMTLKGGGPGTDEDVLQYKECVVVEPANCTVKEPIVLETTTTLKYLIKPAGKWVIATQAEWEKAAIKGFGDKFVGKKEATIGSVTVEGAKCADAGLYNLTGSYTGVVNNGLEFISELDELLFNKKAAIATGLLEYEGEAKQVLLVSA